MKSTKCIVTTTIQPPTKATIEYCQRKDWTFIIVGDTKTPHDEYIKLSKQYPQVKYLTPEYQEKKYQKLSETIGWKSIQRRNIGFVEAYHLGAELVATIDDDNIPYENWGQHIYINQDIEIDLYQPEAIAFDPLSVTDHSYVWHRGFPIDLLPVRDRVTYLGKAKRKVLVQADLWDGDPDIDAMARLSLKPMVKFNTITGPYGSTSIAPFNSQNTFLSREVLPYYAVLPHIGRMDDIWGGYILQHYFPDSVIYTPATVYQDRNVQDLITNLEKEIIGYRNTYKLLQDLAHYESFLPEETKRFWKVYRDAF